MDGRRRKSSDVENDAIDIFRAVFARNDRQRHFPADVRPGRRRQDVRRLLQAVPCQSVCPVRPTPGMDRVEDKPGQLRKRCRQDRPFRKRPLDIDSRRQSRRFKRLHVRQDSRAKRRNSRIRRQRIYKKSTSSIQQLTNP